MISQIEWDWRRNDCGAKIFTNLLFNWNSFITFPGYTRDIQIHTKSCFGSLHVQIDLNVYQLKACNFVTQTFSK